MISHTQRVWVLMALTLVSALAVVGLVVWGPKTEDVSSLVSAIQGALAVLFAGLLDALGVQRQISRGEPFNSGVKDVGLNKGSPEPQEDPFLQ